MTKAEAVKLANKKPRNKNLQYFVIKWNDEYAIASSSYIKRNPNISYVYKTEGDNWAEIKEIRVSASGSSC